MASAIPFAHGNVIHPEDYAKHGYPHEVWTWMRQHDPVHFWEETEGKPFWAISKHADIQAIGALIMCVLGFVPCYVMAWLLNRKQMLRVPFEVELIGLDYEHQHEENRQAQEVRDTDREVLAQRIAEVNS